MITITQDLQIRRCRRRAAPREPKPAPKPRIQRISKLMALAIRFDKLIRGGAVSDYVQLAELCHVSQPRISQILNLNHLAPDIQEELLLLPTVTSGRDPIHEKLLRPVTRQVDWRVQRAMWSQLKSRAGLGAASPEVSGA